MDMISRFSPVAVDGVPVLMSALEQETFGQTIRDARPIDRSLKTLLVYGAYLPCRVDRRTALADLRAAKGKTIGLVWADLCRWASLEDIQIFTPYDDVQDIPFAALVRTAEWMPGLMGSALAYFVRYPQMSVRMNMLTRRGIFAVKMAQHDRYCHRDRDFKGRSEDWRDYVSECQVHQACDFARVALDYSSPGVFPHQLIESKARRRNGALRG